MNLQNLNNELIEKEFSIEYKGYSALEVDDFLDYLAIEINLLQKEFAKLTEVLIQEKVKNEKLKAEVHELKAEISLLREQKQNLEAKGLANVDIITRLSKLESIVNEE